MDNILKVINGLLFTPVAGVFVLLLMQSWVLIRLSIRNSGVSITAGILGVSMILLLLISGAPAIVNRTVAVLEDRFDKELPCQSESTAIVVLGGGVDSRAETVQQHQFMSPATFARVTLAAQLHEQELTRGVVPSKLILSGGRIFNVSEAQVMQDYLIKVGVDKSLMVLEESSSSTQTNAQQVGALSIDGQSVTDTESPKIRLITSALHMMRAKATFEKAGFEVCPLAANRYSLENVPWYALLPVTSAIKKTDQLLHELVGLVVYKIRGTI